MNLGVLLGDGYGAGVALKCVVNGTYEGEVDFGRRWQVAEGGWI